MFKVVELRDDEYQSTYSESGLTCLTYRIGKKTVPKIEGSLIFAFRDLENAEDFFRGSYRQRILSCNAEVDPIIVTHVISDPNCHTTMFGHRMLRATAFWKFQNGVLPLDYDSYRDHLDEMTIRTIRGTVFCKWVVPIHEVE